jgi:hypothetical protein
MPLSRHTITDPRLPNNLHSLPANNNNPIHYKLFLKTINNCLHIRLIITI